MGTTMTVSNRRSSTGTASSAASNRRDSLLLPIQRPSSVHPTDSFSWDDFPVVGREDSEQQRSSFCSVGHHSKNSSFSSSSSGPLLQGSFVLGSSSSPDASPSSNGKNLIINRPVPTHHNESVSWSDFPIIGRSTR